MRAARYYDQKDIRIEDIDEPVLKPGTVAIDVAWCGICGTDLHEYLEGPIFIPPAGHPHPISGESAPVTMGHEFSGTITALGEGVTGLEVGENVVVEPYIIHEDCGHRRRPAVPAFPGHELHRPGRPRRRAIGENRRGTPLGASHRQDPTG